MTDTSKTNSKKLWNAMIYLAGENNLAEACVFALKGMKRATQFPNNRVSDEKIDDLIKIVAQLDAGGLGGDEVRYILKRRDTDGGLHEDEITRRDTTQTTYRGVLKDFLTSSIILDGVAERYLLVLSGHGGGPNEDFLGRDVELPDTLSIPKVQWVLEEVKQSLTDNINREIGDKFRINVLGLDSCMMSTAEIGYQLRDYVDYMVGSEGFEPNMGWPYDRILSSLLRNPAMEPKELALRIVSGYVTFYSDFVPAGRSVDQAACNLSKFNDLANAIDKLAKVLIDKLSDSEPQRQETIRQLVLAHWEAQSYKDDQFVDLYDFCDLLDQGPAESSATGSVVMKGVTVDPNIRDACREVKKVLTGNGDNSLILQSCYSGPAVQHSHGLSIYFPWSNVVEAYKNLEFATVTKWKAFLMRYVDITRRGRRECPSGRKTGETVEGRLFFNPAVSGFDFLLTGNNRNAPTHDRILSNKVGTMKNPPIDYVRCECEKLYPHESDSTESPAGNGSGQATKGRNNKTPTLKSRKSTPAGRKP
ncbi:MAG TPA: clostripain-related cysteine peptidase [Pyrinomonadaceae bacterium]|nr:clostripain-related cysteine peptidase [Pyrinomonadaceae bacterium]